MAAAPKEPSGGRHAKIEALRREERRHERRRRIIIWSTAGILAAALAGGGVWAASTAKDDGAKPESTAIAGVQTFGQLSQTHVQTPVTYSQTPPVGGDHNPVWLNCMGDVYTKPVPNENAVHSLEHGAVWISYNDKATPADVDTLSAKVKGGHHVFMSPYPTQPGTITLTAWSTQLTVDSASDPRVNAFLTQYVLGPQTPEPGAACTGGLTP
ncbi:DUF3105 domain-containing protein [Kitasatospora camelliae]|uniref:DUF3105 domain-containing protein n=1 Tax=Kitasatospora camelliae TaxID=3156397 RepID=A0AAU8K6Y3_9ACTN